VYLDYLTSRLEKTLIMVPMRLVPLDLRRRHDSLLAMVAEPGD
jgi:hypothetical protein